MEKHKALFPFHPSRVHLNKSPALSWLIFPHLKQQQGVASSAQAGLTQGGFRGCLCFQAPAPCLGSLKQHESCHLYLCCVNSPLTVQADFSSLPFRLESSWILGTGALTPSRWGQFSRRRRGYTVEQEQPSPLEMPEVKMYDHLAEPKLTTPTKPTTPWPGLLMRQTSGPFFYTLFTETLSSGQWLRGRQRGHWTLIVHLPNMTTFKSLSVFHHYLFLWSTYWSQGLSLVCQGCRNPVLLLFFLIPKPITYMCILELKQIFLRVIYEQGKIISTTH